MIANKVSDLIGNTPMLRIAVPHRETSVLDKMETMTPGGSTKDRMAHGTVLAPIGRRLQTSRVVVVST
ncbi:hypothetical protein [Methylobacterium planeticum]|uniref:Pyridoxal-phosphate dependent enzyme n=1 Tax=Methylobacterium planeticum TaxID=2615211 RepID=A0A6N6MUW5_9HYPH|nr:hypothetical protein [Methylobacterium planeticum]KAB1074628.1 hypothetical protein F6X51_05715 [Methylobacterium planeticum]